MTKPLRCRLGWHRWARRSAAGDSTTYLQCARCGKDHDGLRPHWGAGGPG